MLLNYLRCNIWLLAIALFASSVFASEATSFTGEGASLIDYLNHAQMANPDLQAFHQRYQAASARMDHASSLPNPKFQVTSFVESIQTRTGSQENAFMLSQKIPWFGKLNRSKDAAGAEAEALWYAYQAQQLSLTRRISLAFFEYSHTKEAIRLSQKNYDYLKGLEPIVQSKVEGGADINALLRLKVEMGKIGDQLQSLKQHRRVQSAELAKLLALPDTTILPWPVWDTDNRSPFTMTSPASGNENFAIATLNQLIEANNPEIKMLQRTIASAQARHAIAKLASYPDFTLGVNYFEIDGEDSTQIDAGEDAWAITFAVDVPIWLKKNRSVRTETLARQHASEKKLENRLNELKSDLYTSITLLNDANRRLKLYGTELLSLAQQAVDNSRTSYEGGRISILELIDSERSLLDMQLLESRANADAWSQKIIIQTLTNQALFQSL